MLLRQFVDEAGWNRGVPLAEDAAIGGEGDEAAAARPGNADISEATFFLQARRAVFLQGTAVGKQLLFPAGQEYVLLYGNAVPAGAAPASRARTAATAPSDSANGSSSLRVVCGWRVGVPRLAATIFWGEMPVRAASDSGVSLTDLTTGNKLPEIPAKPAVLVPRDFNILHHQLLWKRWSEEKLLGVGFATLAFWFSPVTHHAKRPLPGVPTRDALTGTLP